MAAHDDGWPSASDAPAPDDNDDNDNSSEHEVEAHESDDEADARSSRTTWPSFDSLIASLSSWLWQSVGHGMTGVARAARTPVSESQRLAHDPASLLLLSGSPNEPSFLEHAMRERHEAAASLGSSQHAALVDPTTDGFWNEWELLLTSMDQLVIEQNEARSKAMRDELAVLREQGTQLRKRVFFREHATRYLESLDARERDELRSPLPGFIRSKLLHDTVVQARDSWLTYIAREHFGTTHERLFAPDAAPAAAAASPLIDAAGGATQPPPTQELLFDVDLDEIQHAAELAAASTPSAATAAAAAPTTDAAAAAAAEPTSEAAVVDHTPSFERFYAGFIEQPYVKNTVGALVSVAYLASHLGEEVGLSAPVLGDINWSIWSSLVNALQEELGPRRKLTARQLDQLARVVIIPVNDTLCALWCQAVRNSRQGLAQQGKVVQRIQQEAERKQRHVLDLKLHGNIDARWAPPAATTKLQLDSLRAAASSNSTSREQLRSVLENTLFFRVMVPTTAPANQRPRRPSTTNTSPAVHEHKPHAYRRAPLNAANTASSASPAFDINQAIRDYQRKRQQTVPPDEPTD